MSEQMGQLVRLAVIWSVKVRYNAATTTGSNVRHLKDTQAVQHRLVLIYWQSRVVPCVLFASSHVDNATMTVCLRWHHVHSDFEYVCSVYQRIQAVLKMWYAVGWYDD